MNLGYLSLETSLVEWKQLKLRRVTRLCVTLETSLVEWKHHHAKANNIIPSFLGNFLSGMETIN